MDNIELLKIANSLSTPVYVYDGGIILQNARRLKDAFRDCSVYYSIKANPNREVCAALAQLGLGAEVVTEGEIKVALEAGFTANEMLFTGPGKIAREVKFTIDAGIRMITAESVGQLELIDRTAREVNCKIGSLLRINAPELEYEESENMVGVESHFGLDADSFVAARTQLETLTHTTIIGTQYYAGSQILNPTRLAVSLKHQIEATMKLTKILPIRMDVLDIGGGFGIPYQDGEHEFDLATCARLVRQQIEAANLEPGMKIIVESGRYIVGNAGVFLTRVVDVKEMFGRIYVICDGGMGAFARPMLTRAPHRIEVLRTQSDKDQQSQDCVVCGPSCSSMDSFGKIKISPPLIGDVIAIRDAGAYGWSLGLRSFHCVEAPQEFYLPSSLFAYEYGNPKNDEKAEEVMKFKKILLIDYRGEELDDSYWKRIDSICEKKVLLPKVNPYDKKELALEKELAIEKELKNADCLLVKLGAEVDKDMIDKAPNLKYIGIVGIGYGGIDTRYATSKSITVCNVLDYAYESVAEFAFGAILEYMREIERAKRQAKAYDFSEETYLNVTEIKGKEFGVIGLGQIGGRVAELGKAFGADVKYWSRTRKEKYEKMGIAYQGLEELLETSDVISLNLGRNAETVNFLNADRVQKIKKGAIVINLSPMELVDLDAILARVKQKDLAFILDHSDEMPPEQIEKMKPFMGENSNLVVYPPVAYTTREASALKKEMFVRNIENFLKGKPSNKVN